MRRRFAAGAVLLLASRIASGGAVVEPWQPAGVSSPQFESHPAFDPATGDLDFVRSSPSFEGWRIVVTRGGASGEAGPEDWPPVCAATPGPER